MSIIKIKNDLSFAFSYLHTAYKQAKFKAPRKGKEDLIYDPARQV